MKSTLTSMQESQKSSNFIFEKEVGVDESMKEFAKMTILLAFDTYPNPENDWDKCLLVSGKFEEKYGFRWCSSFIRQGDCCMWYNDYYMKMIYKDYIIKIGKVPKN